MKVYHNDKKGLFISFGECNIPEFKTTGYLLKNIETSDLVVVSSKLLEAKFKPIEKIKYEI